MTRLSLPLMAALVAASSLSACSSTVSDHAPSSSSRVASSAAATPIQLTATNTALPTAATLATAANAASVITPDGSWRITFGAPAQRLSYGGRTYQAPTGSQALAVSWLFTPNPPTTAAGVAPPRPQTSITVGKAVLSANPTTSGTAVVTLPQAQAAHPSAVVTFDGLAQKVDAHGRTAAADAAGYYDGLANTGTGNCPPIASSFSGAGASYSGSCGFGQIVRAPWLTGLGWAGPNQVWVQVTGVLNGGSLSWTTPKSGTNVVTHYTTSGALSGGVLGGAQASNVTKQGDAAWVMTWKAPVSTGSLTLNVNEVLNGTKAAGSPSGTDAPATQQVSVTITTPINFQAK